MSDIFAERRYEVEGEGTLRVSFAEPAQKDDQWTWVCRCQIDWPNGEVSQLTGTGGDKLDSLLRAIAAVRLNIETTNEYLEGKVSWFLGENLDLEVPVPQTHIEWVQEQLASRRS